MSVNAIFSLSSMVQFGVVMRKGFSRQFNCLMIGFILVIFCISTVYANVKGQKHQGAKVQFFNFNPIAGTYDYGYVTNETGQFHHENRGSDGVTVGCYGYVENSGRLRVTHYVSDIRGYRVVRPSRPVKLYVSARNSDPETYDDDRDSIIRTEYRPWSSLFSARGCEHSLSRPTRPVTTTTRRPTRPQITARPPITIILNGTITGLDEESPPPSGKPEQDGAAGSLVEGLLGGTDLDLDLNLDQPSESDQSSDGNQPEQDLPLVGGVLGGLLGGGSSGQSGNPDEGGEPDQQGALTPVVGGLVDGLLGGTDLELDLNLDQPQEGSQDGQSDTADDQIDQQGALTPVVGGLVDGLLGGTDLELDLNIDQPGESEQPNQDDTVPQDDGLLGGLLGGGSSEQSENPSQPDPPGILTPVVGGLVEGLLGGTDLGLDTNIGRVPSYYLPYLYDIPENVPRIPCGHLDCSKDTFGYLGLTPTVYVSKSLAEMLGLTNLESDSKNGQKIVPMHVLSTNEDGSWIAEIVERTHESQEEFDAVDQ
ncbi:uncharacterized protein LOC120422950 [Culex pipiens pallens]|uniref:uncharacterized protein LOC120422950 n=1 Tax=Culex pipiens pallens TaxID=42434 RepID=UPI0022AADAC1|nr:uncharacterized protein LOC120422950 [Culex pipiens pallens]